MPHSAVVVMALRVDGNSYRIRAMAPGWIVLDSPVLLPPCQGECRLSIDNSFSSWPVVLPDGVDPARRKTRIAFPARRPHA